jgi:hypothetical protein
MTVIRVPFLIERLENSPGGPFSQQDLQQLQSIVAYAATKGSMLSSTLIIMATHGDRKFCRAMPRNRNMTILCRSSPRHSRVIRMSFSGS